MRKATIIILPVLAVALLAAMIALWPPGALAGLPAQISAPARIQSLAFANAPSSGDYTAGEHIRITVTFDQNVTVTGQPKIALDIGRQRHRATYYQGSGSSNLTFSYQVQASDWDGNGVSVPAGSLDLSGGAIIDSNNLAVSRTHSGIADDAIRKVKGSTDTNPSFGSAAISAQTYPKGTVIIDLILPAAAGGNGLLIYSLHPAPPEGLAFNAVARTLSGAPSATQNAITYTYTAVDGDEDTVSLSFTITVDGTPSFPGTSGTLGAQTYAKGQAIARISFLAATDGNTPLTYSLSPTPPDGLVFDATALTLSGAPTTTQNAVTYTYTVTDADGDTDSQTLSITVDGAPSFPEDAIGPQTYAKGAAITSLRLPTASDGNTPLTYSLSPSPLDGLVFNAAARTLSGTPTTTQNAVSYTYTATDVDGDTAMQSFTITVDGTPSFPAGAVSAQTYTRGEAITSLTLPAATDGNAPLTYSLSPAPPDGLVFNAVARTLSGNPSLGQAATTYTYTATDADGDTAVRSFTIAVTGDYDLDDDGLIEIDRLAQLNAVRWDLNGDGAVDTGTSVADTAKYNAAFTGAVTGMGCLRDHDDNAMTAKVSGCIGYELAKDLDFDTDSDGATYTTSSAGVVTGDAGDTYYNGGKGWTPIGTWSSSGPSSARFTATFDGNDKTISNMFIKDTSTDRVGLGLFASIGTGGRIERLPLRNLNVTGRDAVGGLAGVNWIGATISGSSVTGSVTATGAVAGGLVGGNRSTIIASYASASVTGNQDSVGGLAGYNSGGSISASYATGSVTGTSEVGGLVGNNTGTICASYATGSVTGSGNVGGLAGSGASHGGGTIIISYATGSVTGTASVGGLAGSVSNTGTVYASYATGSVTGTTAVGGLIGAGGTVTNSYWNTGSTGKATSAAGVGKNTRELQSPTGYSGIYAGWNANLDGVAGNDDPWDFGTSRHYPVLKYGGLDPARQRQTTVQSDNWNTPVVGEPVIANLNVDGATGVAWQWQNSAAGATWTDIASATGPTYVPAAADAASGGKFLRANVTFTASGKSQTLTTVNTAKVLITNTATAGAAATVLVMVGKQLNYQHASVTAAGESNRTDWRWQRCDDAAMTTNCKLRAQSNAGTDAHTEYTPIAGTDSDVGKYLRAYAYYSDSGNSNAWTRTQTPILGPVVAAPAPIPTTTPTP